MYEIETTDYFKKKYKKLVSKNDELRDRIIKAIETLKNNPKHKSLRSHKVTITEFGKVYSSSVTGDIRIIWTESNKKLVLLLLDIGGHSGGIGVY